MRKAILTIGAPASGKSTWARQFVADNPGWIIVERDKIRLTQGFDYSMSKVQIDKNEKIVTKIQRGQIESALNDGLGVVVSDTNVNPQMRASLIKFLHQHGADVELKVFEVGLDELIMRDTARADTVGMDVVNRMYHSLRGQIDAGKFKQLDYPVQTFTPYTHALNNLESAYVVDFDGTVAEGMGHRSPYDYTRVIDDEPIKDVIDTVNALAWAGYTIIGVSGRKAVAHKDTVTWAQKHGLHIDTLYTRADNDERSDWVIKNEIYDREIIPKYNILGVFDDRDQVVYHLRSRGLTVFQVNYGRF